VLRLVVLARCRLCCLVHLADLLATGWWMASPLTVRLSFAGAPMGGATSSPPSASCDGGGGGRDVGGERALAGFFGDGGSGAGVS
jgi:hypothetical protein